MSVAETQTAVPKPKRRWYRYGLRMFLVFVALCAIACSWLVPMIRKMREDAEKEAERIANLRQMEAKWKRGSRIVKRTGGRLCSDSTWTPGDAYVYGFGEQFSDGGVERLVQQLKGISEIGVLDLSSTQITDKGLVFLEEMRQLKALDINDTQVTNEGIKKLQQALRNCKIAWPPPAKDERQSPAALDQPGG